MPDHFFDATRYRGANNYRIHDRHEPVVAGWEMESSPDSLSMALHERHCGFVNNSLIQ
jgi:hypothetical protein